MVERNTAGIEEAGRKRTQKKIEAAKTAIESLQRRGLLVNFESVALEAACSRAFLYKQPALKAKIEELRGPAGNQQITAAPASRLTDSSKDKVIEALRSKIERLQEDLKAERREKKELSQALEKALGEALHWKDVHFKMMVRYEKHIAPE
jgi:hypothetical protein